MGEMTFGVFLAISIGFVLGFFFGASVTRKRQKKDNSVFESLVFKECSVCASKPGSPLLCESCCHNRRVIFELRSMVEK